MDQNTRVLVPGLTRSSGAEAQGYPGSTTFSADGIRIYLPYEIPRAHIMNVNLSRNIQVEGESSFQYTFRIYTSTFQRVP